MADSSESSSGQPRESLYACNTIAQQSNDSQNALSMMDRGSSPGASDALTGAAPPLLVPVARRTSCRRAAVAGAALRRVGVDDGFVYGSEMESLMRSASRARRVSLTGSKRKRPASSASGLAEGSDRDAAAIVSAAGGDPPASGDSEPSRSSAQARGDARTARAGSESQEEPPQRSKKARVLQVATASEPTVSESNESAAPESTPAGNSESRGRATGVKAGEAASASTSTASGSGSAIDSAQTQTGPSSATGATSGSRLRSSTSTGTLSAAECFPLASRNASGKSRAEAAAAVDSSAADDEHDDAHDDADDNDAHDDADDGEGDHDAAAAAAPAGGAGGTNASHWQLAAPDTSVDVGGVRVERKYIMQARGALNVDQKRMSKSRAKGEYALSDQDLATLRYEAAENPHYASAAPMRLYRVVDLKDLCLGKYGSAEGLALKLQKNARAAAKRRATIRAKPPTARPRVNRYRSLFGWGDGYDKSRDSDSEGSDSEGSDSWREPEPGRECAGCGFRISALDCAFGMCCHCCRDMDPARVCFRHHGRF